MIRKKPAITTYRQPASATREMIQAEVSAPEQQRRGRLFVSIYSALVLLAVTAFVALSLLVRDKDVLGRIDVPLTRAVQGVHLPVYNWILTHASDLGWFPLDIVSYAAADEANKQATYHASHR